MDMTIDKCGHVLMLWLGKECAPEKAKFVAGAIGYKDNPLFGAAKKKAILVGEIAILNTAIACSAVKHVFDSDVSDEIISAFLKYARQEVYGVIKKLYPKYDDIFEERLNDYIKVIHGKNPGIMVAFILITNLGLKPLDMVDGQIILSAHFSEGLRQTVDVLSRINITKV